MSKQEDKAKSTPAIDDLVAQWFVHIQEYAREHGVDPDRVAHEFSSKLNGKMLHL